MENKQVTSKDGTVIGYKQTGSGPGLIIVHGGGRMANDYDELAAALADSYTVYAYDRRGRGLSGKISKDHCIEKECEDLAAMLTATNAEIVFGHSMGGIIALEAACRYPIANIAVYEPPVSFDNSIPTAFMADFKAALDQKRYERAMVVSLKGLQMHESAVLPLWLLTTILKILKVIKGKAKDWNKRMAETLPTLVNDMEIIKQLNNCFEKYRNIRSLTLLMGGSKSPSYLLQPLDRLKTLIPYASKQVFTGFYHMAPEENVVEISASLKQFFK